MAATQELRKFVAPEIISGCDAHQLAGQYAECFGLSRVLVVSDPGVEAEGWTALVLEKIRAAGVIAIPFSAVTPNPKDHEVMAGVERYRADDCKGIIAVGGGSPIDCAKGIGIVCSNGGHILDYVGVDQIRLPMPPLICIPTTSGAAADISQFAIITDTAEQRKTAIISKSLVPDIALLDPLLTMTMPPELTAATGIDALVHAIEAYVSNASSPFTDLHALEAIRLVTTHLPAAIDDPASLADREAMQIACTQAGLAFSNASLGAVHAMAHSLGGMLDAPHGECNAQLLEHVIAFNFSAAPARYRQIARVIGLDLSARDDAEDAAALIATLAAFRRRVGITTTLSEQGVTRADLYRLAGNALQDACMVTNPRWPTQQEIEGIYAAAL